MHIFVLVLDVFYMDQTNWEVLGVSHSIEALQKIAEDDVAYHNGSPVEWSGGNTRDHRRAIVNVGGAVHTYYIDRYLVE